MIAFLIKMQAKNIEQSQTNRQGKVLMYSIKGRNRVELDRIER